MRRGPQTQCGRPPTLRAERDRAKEVGGTAGELRGGPGGIWLPSSHPSPLSLLVDSQSTPGISSEVLRHQQGMGQKWLHDLMDL